MRRGFRLPDWLGTLATTGVLLVCAHTFFYPPVVPTGLADKVLESFRQTFAAPLMRLAGR